jgi:excinuclease UvrABC nuclease subunit
MGRWKTYRLFASELPTCGGTYVVIVDGVVGYVGCATNLRARLRTHNIRPSYSRSTITPWGFFSECTVKYRPTVKYGDWAMVELRLLRRLQPKFNIMHINRKEVVSA